MLPTVLGYVSKPLVLQLGLASLINKHAIIPAGMYTASKVSKFIGNTTDEENRAQEELFKEFISPVTNILDQFEDEILSMFNNYIEPLGVLLGLDDKSVQESLDKSPISSVQSDIVQQT